MQTVINCAILICVIFLMISGIILSWCYLILQQKFFFLDFERGYFLFALDYISIIILFATVIHHASPMMKTIAALREKYDLHMTVERFVSDDGGVPESDRAFIRK